MTNFYKRFRELSPEPPLQVGEVVAYSDGVATIELPGGALTQARGLVTVGDIVFFSNAVIQGPAPTLPVELIEV